MAKNCYRILPIALAAAAPYMVRSQCAMCRTQVVNNVSHGDTSLAEGLNLGILYLFFAPYLLLGVIAFFWHKNAKVKAKPTNLLERLKKHKF